MPGCGGDVRSRASCHGVDTAGTSHAASSSVPSEQDEQRWRDAFLGEGGPECPHARLSTARKTGLALRAVRDEPPSCGTLRFPGLKQSRYGISSRYT